MPNQKIEGELGQTELQLINLVTSYYKEPNLARDILLLEFKGDNEVIKKNGCLVPKSTGRLFLYIYIKN